MLIMLMMFAPLRGAIAVQQTHCDMNEMAMPSAGDNVMPGHDMSGHDMTAMNSMVAVHQEMAYQESSHEFDQSSLQPDHQCCCCDGADCAGNCDMGMTVSLLLQQSPYQPVFKGEAESATVSSTVLLRELTPPSRPPAKFHN